LNDYKEESGVFNLGNQKNISDLYKKQSITLYDQRKNIKFTNLNMSEFENKIISNDNESEKNLTKRKLGVALIYSTLFSNGIARFLQVTGNYLAETGRYNVYFITGKPYHKEYKFHKDIKRFIGENNYTIIRNISKHYKIDFFILHNVIGKSAVNFFSSLGAKVIGMFHGNFMSGLFLNDATGYKHWTYFDYYDAFVFIGSDDYFFYNKLQFKNHIFIPNLYTFEPSQVQSSNLTTHNLIMLGRQNDKIKGAIYAIKAMDLIVKEVPDAVLYLITSDSRIDFIKNLTKELNLTKSIKIVYHTYNISDYFYNCSVHLYPSLSEAFPMAMNEGKAHGMPIVAFDVPISNPYQSGVITVDSQDYVALARESIKLLKDINYRRRMGKLSKLSLNMFNNNETVRTWERLFDALIEDKGDKTKFHDLQKEIQDKYYNEERAKIHIEKHFRDIKRFNTNLSCVTIENFTTLQNIKNISECKILNETINITNNM
jgi:glycosyltransferase involved in cell wall biosynthesis